MEISNYIHKRIQLSIYYAKIALWRHIYKLIDSELGTLSGPFRRFPRAPGTDGRKGGCFRSGALPDQQHEFPASVLQGVGGNTPVFTLCCRVDC